MKGGKKKNAKGEKGPATKKEKASHDDDDDDDDNSDDDEFFDRTKKKDGMKLSRALAYINIYAELLSTTQVETYETLTAKKTDLEAKKDALKRELVAIGGTDSGNAKQTSKFSVTKLFAATKEEDEDSLDAFMNTNAASIQGDKKKRIQAQIADLEKDEAKLDRLIKRVAPALKPMAPRPAPKVVEKAPAPVPENPAESKPAAEEPKKGKKETVRAFIYIKRKF